jgi:hypothetical protein
MLQELNLAAEDLTNDKKTASILLLAQIGYSVATVTTNFEITALRFTPPSMLIRGAFNGAMLEIATAGPSVYYAR